MRILLTGSKGQLAHCLKDRLPNDWELIATDTTSLDITDETAVINMVDMFQPDAIINAAAFTNVDNAESHVEAAFASNATAVYYLAKAAKAAQARFIHISTDYVFDGKGKSPYRTTDYTNPNNIYGKSKLAGELLALANHPDTIIIRTSWLFSEYGNNFVKTMLKLAAEHDSLSVVNDQIGNPTYAGDLAIAIIELLKQSAEHGIYHYSGSKPVSWYDFARAIFQTASTSLPDFKMPQLQAIPGSEFPRPAARPSYSVLDNHKIEFEIGLSGSDWQKALEYVIPRIND